MNKQPAIPEQLIPPDLIKMMAMDVGKEVAAYIERMYPNAVEAASSTFLLSLRNCVYNEIMATIGTSNPGEIEQRLERRKTQRRKLRALHKAAMTIQPGEVDHAMDLVKNGAGLAPDL